MAGYFSQYVYMPKVVQPEVVIDCVWQLDEVLHIELDGFAYADAFEDKRYIGLTLKKPTDVRPGGLILDPAVARQQIEKDIAASEAAAAATSAAGGTSPAAGIAGTSSGGDSIKIGPTGTPVGVLGAGPIGRPLTRFNATKELTSARVVRDVSQVYEEIIAHFVSAGARIKVTFDIESDQLDRLTDDQRAAIRENLAALGFADDNWSMD